MEVASAALTTVGQAVQYAFFDRMRTYLNYVKNCDMNLMLLLENLENLLVEKGDIDDKVMSGKENLEILTGKAARWLARVRDFTKDETMKKLMKKDMEIAKVMLRLMKDDLRKLVEKDVDMRDMVLKVMKDVAKIKRNVGNGEVSDAEKKDKEVGQVLEKLIEETMQEFKTLMQNDMNMAVAALHLLENHTENLERLTEKDEEVADIIAKAREMSVEEELLSDHSHDNVLAHENSLREKVTNLLTPVRELILNKDFLKALPENVRLGMEAMGVVTGNRRGLKTELMDAGNTVSHVDCCCCVISYSCLSDRHDMSVAAEAMLIKIKDIIGKKPGSQDVTRPLRRGEMEDIPTNRIGLKSRNELLQKIINALASNDVHAVGIFGMGGSGKTTLAKEVANSKANDIFETIVMVEVSESPNIEFIQDQIANGLGLELHNVHGTRDKAIRLYNKMKPRDSKTILVILDNIWHKIDLVQMGIPLDYCKFVLTSREKNVCRAMDVVEANLFEVGLLNENEAKDLFHVQVQKEVHTGEYKSIVNRLLEKCRGLPLSIVATANSLKGKELSMWRQFAEESEKPISCQISGVQHETFSILRTSYEFVANDDKKKFFLLACLSPLGSSISVDNLMRYGIGLSLFQHVNKLSEAIELSRTWAEELVSSSMLLKGVSKEYVKIHDVVRQSTMSFASNTGLNTDGHMFLVDVIPKWIWEEKFNKYIGISLLTHANFARLSGVKAVLLQILLLKGDENQSSFLDSNFFVGMTNLKVLELLFMNFKKGLPESLCKLKVLKTLHLVECELGDIKLIGELGSLLVLSLRGSSLEGLPDEIGKLYQLRLLDMSKCRCKEPRILAKVIARLSLLEGLYLFDSSRIQWDWAVTKSTSNDTGVTNGSDMDKFNELKCLNVLELRMLGPISLPISAQFVGNLDKFQIIVGQEGFKLQPFQRALMVSKFDVSQELKKGNCLKTLLKKADFLALKKATVKNIVPELDKEGYRDLSRLELSNINNISRICEGKAPTQLFLNLRHLEVSHLNNLIELLPVNPLPHHLTKLKISDCNNLNYIFSEDDGINKESDIIKLPGLKTLKLDKVSNLISVVKQSNSDDRRHPSFFNSKVKLTLLEELWLGNNKSIVKLWDEESNLHSFQNLKVLEINGCEELVTIGPLSMFLSLVQLESLYISNCNKMQQVISDGSETQEIPTEVITFPKMKSLWISYSKNLECFYGGSYIKMAFSRLEELHLCYLKRVTKFAGGITSTAFFSKTIEFPCLEKLWLMELSDEVRVLWDLAEGESEGLSSNPVPNLRQLYIKKIKLPSIVFSNLSRLDVKPVVGDAKFLLSSSSENEGCVGTYSHFPKLEELSVRSCPDPIKQLFNDDCSTAMLKFCGQLSSLRLESALNMEVVSLHLFKSLCNLCISNLSWKYLFSANGSFEQLQSLEHLKIWNCPNLEAIIRGGDKDSAIVFPQLKRLYLLNLERMSKFCTISDIPFHFRSLERLNIASCNNLGTVCSASFVAPRLRGLTLKRCNELHWLFSGETNQAIELPSLENVIVDECDAMKSLSTRPLKAPKLRKLAVSNCPKKEWLLLGNSKCGGDLELSSVEFIVVKNCPNMKLFSPAALRAPKLQVVTVDNKPYPIAVIEDLNHFLQYANSSEQTSASSKQTSADNKLAH